MGQVLRQDKIGQLTHSSGNIIMAASVASPAYLTIGGRQYTVTSNLSVALPSMAANTRYQVFAVQSGGVVSLQISLNENSVGPAGFLSWKLIGSLYSNGMSPVAFGSFVNIKGAPETDVIDYNPTINNFGTTTSVVARWRRSGDNLEGSAGFTSGTHAAAPGSISLPSNFSLQATKLTRNNLTSAVGSVVGHWGGGNASFHGGPVITAPASNSSLVYHASEYAASSASPLTATNANSIDSNSAYEFTFRVPIAGWSNTPIEDL